MRILVVDDTPEVRAVIAHVLQDAGHEVVEADNAKAAIETLGKLSLAAVLTELHLPYGSGRDVAEEAVRNEVPAVIFSGDVLLAEEMEQAGMRILRKPFSLDVLTQWLDEAIARQAWTGGQSATLESHASQHRHRAGPRGAFHR